MPAAVHRQQLTNDSDKPGGDKSLAKEAALD